MQAHTKYSLPEKKREMSVKIGKVQNENVNRKAESK